MLQMLNFDSYGNVSLNPNIIHETPNNDNDNNNSINNINNNTLNKNNTLINNKGKNDFKKRINSANPKFKITFKEKNKNRHSGYKDRNIGLTKTINEMLPDIYDISGTQKDEGPKITKVIKKNLNKQYNKQNGSSNY